MFNKKQKGLTLRNSKGFTLIELLVVIAIIGLLAGIVLVSLGGARDSARNARIQSAMQQVKSVAELVYNGATPLQYNGVCAGSGTGLNSAHATYGTQLDAIASDVSTQGGFDPSCYATGDNYCISAPLVGGTTICVSSAGQTGNDVCAAAAGTCTPT